MIQCSARCLHHTTTYIIVVFSRFSDPKVPFHGRDSEAVTEDSHAWGLNEIYGLKLPVNEGIKRCHWLKLLSPSTNAMNKIVTFGKFERYPSLSWTSWTSNVAIGITSFKMLSDLMFRLSSLIQCGMAVNKSCVLSYSQGELFTASRQKCTTIKTKTKTLGRLISTDRAAKDWLS